MSTEKTTQIGGYELNYVQIHSFSNSSPVDITELIAQIDVYESISSPFMSLDISIIDNLGLIDKIPIVGEELIGIDLRDQANLGGLNTYTCFLYKISDREQISDRGFSYKLKCLSLECLADMNIKLSRAFNGTPSNLVKDIINKNGSLMTEKPLVLGESRNNVSYISNYWSPSQNIRYVMERAISKKNGAPSFVFFENMDYFVFDAIDNLVDKQASATYFFTVNPKSRNVSEIRALTGDTTFDNRQSIVENMWVDDTFDYINRVSSGALGTRTLRVDPFKKEYLYDTYDFTESFLKYNRLNKKPLGTNNAVRKLNSVFRTKVTPSSSFTGMVDDGSDEWFRKRLTEISCIESQTIQIDVPGRMGILTGQVVEFVMFAGNIPDGESSDTTFLSTADRVFSGRYLVTGIHHTFDRERHYMSLKLNKESLISK
jgi:hypothetical protein